MSVGRAGRRLVALSLALLVTASAACTDQPPTEGDAAPSAAPSGEPSTVPSTGLRVAFVLPPAERVGEDAEEVLRTDLARVRRAAGRDVDTVQVVRSDGLDLTSDVVAFLAEDGNDLVCALGPGAAEAVLAVAERFPRTRFCVTPARLDPAPPNVVSVDVRVEEAAFLAGAAGGLVSGAEPPGFIAGSDEYAVDRRRRAFTAGMAAVGSRVAEPFIGFPADSDEQATAMAAGQLAAGVPVIHAVAGPRDAVILASVQSGGGLVTGSLETLVPHGEEPVPTSVLMTISTRYDLALAPVLELAVGAWEGGVVSVGLAEGVLSVAGGGSARWASVAERITELRDGLVDGAVVALPEA